MSHGTFTLLKDPLLVDVVCEQAGASQSVGICAVDGLSALEAGRAAGTTLAGAHSTAVTPGPDEPDGPRNHRAT